MQRTRFDKSKDDNRPDGLKPTGLTKANTTPGQGQTVVGLRPDGQTIARPVGTRAVDGPPDVPQSLTADSGRVGALTAAHDPRGALANALAGKTRGR